jgi:hypothetical protein
MARTDAALKKLHKNDDDNEQDENDNVQWPRYTYDPYFKMDVEREEDKPDPKVFFEVGYDPRVKISVDITDAVDEAVKEEIMQKEGEDDGN